MSIETDLKRIADGVDQIVAILSAQTLPKVEVVQPVNTGAAAYADKVTATIDKVVEKAIVEPTEEEIRTAIREYMNKNGKDKAIELLIKYGAKQDKPMIKDVTNKTALMKEVTNG